MHLPLDYTRINQFPEWCTGQAGASYLVKLDSGRPRKQSGTQLVEGLPVKLKAGRTLLVEVSGF